MQRTFLAILLSTAAVLLSAAAAHAASTITTSAQSLSQNLPNGRKIVTIGGRLYTVFMNGPQVNVASTLDGKIWAMSVAPPVIASPMTPVITGHGSQIAVLFKDLPGLFYVYCTPTNGACNSWNGPVYLTGAGGWDPSAITMNGQIYAAWRDHHQNIWTAVFPLGSTTMPTPVQLHARTFADETNSQPAIAGRWNFRTLQPEASVFWVRSTSATQKWELRRATMTSPGVWQSTIRKQAAAGFSAPSVHSVAAAANARTGVITVGLSVHDQVNGPRSWILNDTNDLQINSLPSYISIDPFDTCGPNVRIAVGPLSGGAWRRDIDQAALVFVNNQVLFPASSTEPVATTWWRNSGTVFNRTFDGVDGIVRVVPFGPNYLEASDYHGTGWRATPLCP